MCWNLPNCAARLGFATLGSVFLSAIGAPTASHSPALDASSPM
jgi:hypothetical protein